jgi:Tfp pilus assembly protein PilF/transglutaminase-like putative cysteine protease
MRQSPLLPALLLLAALALSPRLPAQTTARPARDRASVLIGEALGGWEKGGTAAVERKLREAITADPSSPRPYLLLSYLYTMERRQLSAWRLYDSALSRLPNRYPYLYAAWRTPKIDGFMDRDSETVGPTVAKLAAAADSLGVMRPMALEKLALARLDENDLEGYRSGSAAIGAVRDWMVIGPFGNVSSSGYDKVYPPELGIDVAAKYTGKNGIPAWWLTPAVKSIDSWVHFLYYFAEGGSTYYANTFIYSPTRRRAQMRIGVGGSFKAFLNDEQIMGEPEEYATDIDAYIAEVTLQEGWNRVLVKCGTSDDDGSRFILRMTDPAGDTLAGLVADPTPHNYRSHPGESATPVPQFATAYFEGLIRETPDGTENYLLLADCQMHDGRYLDAQQTLLHGLERAPASPLLLNSLYQAYTQNSQSDEADRIADRLYAIDRDIPDVIEHRFWQRIGSQAYDQAEELVARYERLLPKSSRLYAMKISLYGKKDQEEKLIETAYRAYESLPGSSEFAFAVATLATASTKTQDSAIAIYSRFLREHNDEGIRLALAAAYLQAHDMENYRRAFDDLLKYSPANFRYYDRLAVGYYTVRDFANAVEALRTRLTICPSSGRGWRQLGDVRRTMGDTAGAIEAYGRSLDFLPSDFDVRDALRDLQGKRSPFEQFRPIDVDSVIAHAHTAAPQTDAETLVLLDRAQSVLYGRGVSETSQEYVVKVLNRRGIDLWKEYTIPTYDSDQLVVDKAVVVKKDGSETPADISNGYVVFKTLAENDVIHMKWHIREGQAAEVPGEFFDTFEFGGFYPTEHTSYELLVPKGFSFHHSVRNMPDKFTRREVADGTIYTWAIDDLRPLPYEYDMPELTEVGRILRISTAESWRTIVDWYADVATAKSKGTYEIADEVRELLHGIEGAGEREKIAAIYNFITENIRYSSVSFRQGGYIPQKARDVLVNKIGDCKDVATLCIAMLREAGLKANYVLVGDRESGSDPALLPSIPFDHCIVAVETKEGREFLDLTASNYPIGAMPDGDLGALALVVEPATRGPVNLPERSAIPRNRIVDATAELRDDNMLRKRCQTVVTGALAASYRDFFRDQSKKDREDSFLAELTDEHAGARLLDLTVDGADTVGPTLSYRFGFDAPDYLSDAGTFKLFRIPWSTPATPDGALSYEEREYPYEYLPEEDTLIERMTLHLPEGYRLVELPADVTLRSPIADYDLHYATTGAGISAERRLINKKDRVSTREYAAFRTFYNSVVKNDARMILLRRADAH